ELARCWTNIEYGMRELSNKDGVTELEAFAWDKETNTTSSQRFTVRHKRDTRNGSYDITDQRDIYELGANNGARRMRARILAILPSDLVQAAEEKCRQTLEGGSQKPMADQVREMTSAFQERFQVTGEMIERLIGKKRGDFLPEDITRLRGVFKSLKDGMAQVSDFFGNPEIADPKADGKKDGNKPPAASNDNKPPAATKPSGGSRRKSNKATTTKKDGEGEQQDQPAQETQDDNPAAEQEQEQTAEQQSGDGATTGSGEDDDFDGMFDND
ncbi:MAG TPA: hypothetical protein VFX91_02190, partial [Alcanivorax sp.]|nr:hypothetical protein [Alcanivorax sp.]